MDNVTRERILKLLEGIPTQQQIKIVRAAKVVAKLRADQAKAGTSQFGP